MYHGVAYIDIKQQDILCRFIDVLQDRKLQLWKTDAAEYSFSSLVSAICSCGSENIQADGGSSLPSWIATGLSSGHCRLLDVRCGNIIARWRAHDGYITKVLCIKYLNQRFFIFYFWYWYPLIYSVGNLDLKRYFVFWYSVGCTRRLSACIQLIWQKFAGLGPKKVLNLCFYYSF